MNKRIYKLQLLCIKYLPMIISVIVVVNVILSYFDINIYWVNYFAGSSVLTLIPFYISSYLFKFCAWHRMFIHYILIQNAAATCDELGYIRVSDEVILSAYLLILGICVFLAVYLHQRQKKHEKLNKELTGETN